MDKADKPEILSMEIAPNLILNLREDSTWQAIGKEESWDLKDTKDFRRVIVLLERPFAQVKETFELFVRNKGVDHKFPLWRVVGAGLMTDWGDWTDLALAWFPNLEDDEKVKLRGLLEDYHKSKRGSQKGRHLAKKYAKALIHE